MFFLLYKHTDDGVLMIFRRFPTTFRRFPKISKKFSEGQTNVPEHFPRISEKFRRRPKVSEDYRRLPRKTRRSFDDTPTNLSTIYETNLISPKSSISSHVKISYRFYQFVTTRYTTDFYIIKRYLSQISSPVRYVSLKVTEVYCCVKFRFLSLNFSQNCIEYGINLGNYSEA